MHIDMAYTHLGQTVIWFYRIQEDTCGKLSRNSSKLLYIHTYTARKLTLGDSERLKQEDNDNHAESNIHNAREKTSNRDLSHSSISNSSLAIRTGGTAVTYTGRRMFSGQL